MQLKNYQVKAVEELLRATQKLLTQDFSTYLVFKAPTGSGKTIIMAEFLQQFAQLERKTPYAYLWISGNELHTQSRGKLEDYMNDSRYTLSYLEEVQDDHFQENEIIFINWHSLVKKDKGGEYSNVYMKDTEQDKSLPEMIRRTKEVGTQLILIVDESHYHYWSDKTQELVKTVMDPQLTIEVSATPAVMPTQEDGLDKRAETVKVAFEDVIAEGMIKKQVAINQDIGNYANFNGVADEIVLEAALQKLYELERGYKEKDIDIQPLLMIQLPNASKNTDSTDQAKIDLIKSYLSKNHDITFANDKLALWLSDEKENRDGIEKSDNSVRVLIFKQAIALGWDCPRAQILVMFRDIKSQTFEIQTVGRILRMPEAKHYESDLLDKAYVYTNLDRITVKSDVTDKGYFEIHRAVRKEQYADLKLPSTYVSRSDYGDLTYTYRRLFVQVINKRFGITQADMGTESRKKADIHLDLELQELTRPVLADVMIDNLDEVRELTGSTVNFTVSPNDVKRAFELYAKTMSLPYGPVRSHTKIQSAFYDWFDGWLGYASVSRLEIQRIVVCSKRNLELFTEIVNETKELFKDERAKELMSKIEVREYAWDVPRVDLYNDLYSQEAYAKYIMEPCYFQIDRSEVERGFERILDKSQKVKWWYKNGTSKDAFFAIPYSFEGFTRSFYPDFIVSFIDGTTGVYETKGGITKDQAETAAKSEALKKYIRGTKSKNLTGGIVVMDKTGWYVFEGEKYAHDIKNKDWMRLSLEK